jgi:PAS domain S-box-containing protein
MKISSIISICFILTGAVIMAVSLYDGRKSYRFFKGFDNREALTVHRFNNIHHFLMFFFFLGYLAVAIAIKTQTAVIGDLFVGMIFFFGAIFVLLGIRLQSAMNSMISKRYEIAHNALAALKKEQVQLLKSNQLLAKEIQERQQAERIAREREFRLQQILSCLPIGIMIVDAKTHEIIEVNPKAESIIGASSEVIKGSPCHTFVCAARKNNCPMHISDHTSVQGEHLLACADGQQKPILKSVSRIELDGNPHFLEAFLDISEKKKLEMELQHSQNLEVIGTLAGGVAHDLNNILSGLISYPELLLMNVEENNPLKEPLERIKRSGEKAGVIVQDLLTLARQNVAIKDAVDLSQVVKEFMGSPEYEQICKRHPNVTFEFVEKSPPLVIEGSPVHMSKIVMNILTNAAESIHVKGTVKFQLDNTYLDTPLPGYDTVNEGDYVVLEIHDNGVGIAEKDLMRIYEPFYTSKVMGQSGSGLGMAVVWSAVQDHGGYIQVESILNRGTVFHLFFPAAHRLILSEADSVKKDIPRGLGQKILVVDDVEEQREIASSVLSYLGYRVQVTASGETAIEALEGDNFDLVLLDMIMEPGIDGLETYRRILKTAPNQAVMLVSGFADKDHVDEMEKLGLSKYVKKPYNIRTIADSIFTILSEGDVSENLRDNLELSLRFSGNRDSQSSVQEKC